MVTAVFIPGLLCDEIVFEEIRSIVGDRANTQVADVTNHDRITDMAEDILDQFKGELDIIGFSMGGRVAFEIVKLAADRVRSLAVMDTGTHSAREGEEEKRYKRVQLAYDKGMGALASQWLPPMIHPDNLGEVIKPLTEMVLRKTPEIHENQIKALLNRPRAGEYISDISCPTLVAVGRDDKWANVEQHRNISKAINGSKLAIIEDAGHFAPFERGVASGTLLSNWLSQQS